MMMIKSGLSFDDVLLIPKKSGIFSRQDVNLKTKLSRHLEISIPLISANMDTVTGYQLARTMAELGGIGIIHRFLPIKEQVNEVKKVKGIVTLKNIIKKSNNSISSKDKQGRLLVGAAIGIKEGELARAQALLEAGSDVLVIDIAHGHNVRALKMIKLLKKKFKKVEIIAGNVATPEGVKDLIQAGADGVKIGIGPGAACTTRLVTGVGVPQITAILQCAKIARQLKVPLIADGGIKNSGDLAKALAAGAQSAMLGSLLAGAKESLGQYIIEDGRAYKTYRGMASLEANQDRVSLVGEKENSFYSSPEGKSGRVPYQGSAKDVLTGLLAGLRSSLSYLGAKDLKEFQRRAEFIKITNLGLKESQARNI
jgi:inosine-5'-monophosphate dehydrogenase